MRYRILPKDSGEATRNPSLQGACEIPDNKEARGRYRCGSCEIDQRSNETASERRELLNLLEHLFNQFHLLQGRSCGKIGTSQIPQPASPRNACS
ncbi:hypothetical protein ALC56_09695 [Trachymyrmex septentrionalis]|uniref:Uncharacterized protein n=1 Tax=Trachymyrmex septentrionalis TaxID=34720 RepID=A0A195F757_9HYME|nr:hypothetical protein ALC56_09695 [Trachymyrmex septentrionalis]